MTSSTLTHQAAPSGALPRLFPAVRSIPAELLLGACSVALLATSAHVKVFTPFSTVPFTFQTLIVLGMALALGQRTTLWSLGAYLTIGLAGAPVFAGGTGGLGILQGATVGYLVGFAAAGWVVGKLAVEQVYTRPARLAALVLLGQAIIYACGVSWLMLGLAIPAREAFVTGCLVFAPWEALKVAILAISLPAFCQFVKRARD